MTRALLTAIFLTLLSHPAWGVNLAEIQLMNKLDDQRGYCIDIRSHKERAKGIDVSWSRATNYFFELLKKNSPSNTASG